VFQALGSALAVHPDPAELGRAKATQDGEVGGAERTLAPAASIAWRTPSILWVRKLSIKTVSPFFRSAREPARHMQ
jgi:hypothetical protein